MKKLPLGIGCALMLATLAEAQSTRPSVEEYPAPLVRERQQVVIEGIPETWELRWNAPPKPACGPNDVSLTCPCTGFAYGEGGDLTLVRIRKEEEMDRLELTPLFEGADVNLGKIAILQRWEPNYDTDFKASEREDLPDVVALRPVVKIMDFVDYDHDGNRSEFYLKTDTLPCGKSVGVIVGVSRSNRKLHVFDTVSKPSKPLIASKENLGSVKSCFAAGGSGRLALW